MRKLIASLTVAATAMVGLAVINSSPAGGSTQVTAAPAYTPPPIQWGPCTHSNSDGNASLLTRFGAQCGFLIVPMDYANPSGRTIKLAVSRVLHSTDSAHYQGVMLVNPGGPGGSGVVYSIFAAFVPHNAGAPYDWIGFDPRGVGSSVPSLSCEPTFFAPPRPAYNPTTQLIMDQWVSRSKVYANACTTAQGNPLFAHVKTTDNVADMESLRIALGQSQINYYGFSYGTYLGSVYMTLHPDRVRRFVLDSTVDPRNVWYQANLNQDVAFQKTFTVYMTWLAQNHAVYDVGNTEAQVEQTFLHVETRLNQHPAGGVLGGDELLDVFTSAAYYVYGWATIGAAYSKYMHGQGPNDLINMYTSANPTGPGGDNGYALYLGTQCTDTQWPQSQAKLNQDSERLNQTAYFFTWANAWFNGPCAYWHYPASHAVTVDGSNVHVPILMIDETFDPATPYEGSLYVRSIFPTASLIEGVDGTTHAGSLSGVACTDDKIASYLLTGAVPARQPGNQSDVQCPPVPPPPASLGAASNSAINSDVLATLRAGTEAAAVHR